MSAEIQVPRAEQCGLCKGTGADSNDGLTQCATCKGKGEVLLQQGFLTMRQNCRTCSGRGQLIRKACPKCAGEGFQRVDRKLRVTIPPGVDNGTRLRLANEGPSGSNGGPSGDLFVVLLIKEHAVFERLENDLHCTVSINVAQAALGTELDVLTFDGVERVKIPEGAQHGEQVRIRGKGVPYLNSGGRGDVIVNVGVKVPGKLSREQRKLFEQLREILPADTEPQERGLFDKVKDYFM